MGGGGVNDKETKVRVWVGSLITHHKGDSCKGLGCVGLTDLHHTGDYGLGQGGVTDYFATRNEVYFNDTLRCCSSQCYENKLETIVVVVCFPFSFIWLPKGCDQLSITVM